jgi:hypothetical protein
MTRDRLVFQILSVLGLVVLITTAGCASGTSPADMRETLVIAVVKNATNVHGGVAKYRVVAKGPDAWWIAVEGSKTALFKVDLHTLRVIDSVPWTT